MFDESVRWGARPAGDGCSVDDYAGGDEDDEVDGDRGTNVSPRAGMRIQIPACDSDGEGAEPVGRPAVSPLELTSL